MNPNELTLKALPASDTVRLFLIATTGIFPNAASQVVIQTNAGNLTFQRPSGHVSEADSAHIDTFLQWAKDRPFVSCGQIEVRELPSNRAIRYHSPDALSAQISLNGFDACAIG